MVRALQRLLLARLKAGDVAADVLNANLLTSLSDKLHPTLEMYYIK